MHIQKYRQTLKYFDCISFVAILLLSGVGLLFVFSATYSSKHPFSPFVIKQIYGLISGLVIYFLCLVPDYRTCIRWGYVGFIGVIMLLLFTLVKGSIGLGAQRWLEFGFLRLQPSELAKLLFPAFVVHHLHAHKNIQTSTLKTFAPIIGILLLSFVLILKQPDLGTALIVLFSGLLICWLAGIGKKFFRYGLLCFLVATPLFWKVLKPYQKNRIKVFLGYGDTQKERYQIEQAKIAIGSGGYWGKGLFFGTQNKLRFLPEGRTDFIFAVLCEELGLIGALFVLMLYAILFFRSLLIIATLPDIYLQIFGFGLISHIILSTFINICMVLGLLPIVGIPLPLMSYGISNLWVTLASFGLLQNISIRQYFYMRQL